MQSKASTVEQYLAELPEDRRQALQAVREVFLKNIDKDFEEGMQYGMMGFYVPYRVYPAGYHCTPKQPLPFVGMASQKNYMSVYMMCVYREAEARAFRKAWAKTGKKLDMGKCCIRFKKLDDLALDVIADVLKRTPASTFIKYYEAAIQMRSKQKPTSAKPKAKKVAAKKSRAK